jgi:hypothetical protein
MLNFQEAMEKERKRNNLRTLFGVEKIPGVDQIRNILDGIEPAGLTGAFDTAFEIAGERGYWRGIPGSKRDDAGGGIAIGSGGYPERRRGREAGL